MPSDFDILASIIGPVLTGKVIAKLGGRHITIRKRFASVQDMYWEERARYDDPKMTPKLGAVRLGCSISCFVQLRRKSRANPSL